jgi:hypothetical protein
MYQAKTNGKSTWAVFHPAMRAAEVERLALESDLAAGLADQQFHLVYQPIVELETGSVVGFEELLCWEHPTRGLVMPDVFIPIAQASGSIVPIGEWVLGEACRIAARWTTIGPGARDDRDRPGFRTQRSRLPASTNSTYSVFNWPSTTSAPATHRSATFASSRSTYSRSTGRSSRASPTRPWSPPSCVGLLDLGRTLNLHTLAEGIELGSQRDSLRDQHCELGQGFLFARPLSERVADAFLNRATTTDRLLGTTLSPTPSDTFEELMPAPAQTMRAPSSPPALSPSLTGSDPQFGEGDWRGLRALG